MRKLTSPSQCHQQTEIIASQIMILIAWTWHSTSKIIQQTPPAIHTHRPRRTALEEEMKNENLAYSIQSIGNVFMKFAQVISTRPTHWYKEKFPIFPSTAYWAVSAESLICISTSVSRPRHSIIKIDKWFCVCVTQRARYAQNFFCLCVLSIAPRIV